VSGRYDYDGDAALAGPVDRALRRVVDPEMALGIVSMGLVYAVEARDGVARVRMTMTSAACPVTEMIVADVEQELLRALGDGWRAEVEVCWEPPWGPERMTAAAREAMGWE
jgi:metal-sulfur cluster biosynthetic enzyme